VPHDHHRQCADDLDQSASARNPQGPVRILRRGLLRLATDHPDYGSGLEPLLATVPSLSVLAWEALPPPPPTNYALKYEREGRPIWRFLARKG